MKLNTAIVNNYLKDLSPEYRELLEALLENFDYSISNLSPAVLGYSKEKALNYISEAQYNLFHHLLPRNFFFTDEDIREQVMDLMPTLNQKEIKKIYLLLLNQRDTPEEEIFQPNLTQPKQR